jgi:hypothetical protein
MGEGSGMAAPGGGIQENGIFKFKKSVFCGKINLNY